jgi:hypothetical protein
MSFRIYPVRKTSEIIDLVSVFDGFENTEEENFQE